MILLHRLANLKYNRPDLKWNQVKIITPNRLFNTYIDALSENLGINMIVRCTMSEYYILLIARYRDLFNIFGGKRANEKIYAERHSSKGDEIVDTWVSNYVYSKEFAYALTGLALQRGRQRDCNRLGNTVGISEWKLHLPGFFLDQLTKTVRQI